VALVWPAPATHVPSESAGVVLVVRQFIVRANATGVSGSQETRGLRGIVLPRTTTAVQGPVAERLRLRVAAPAARLDE
jgi:hypothetical protein